MQFNSKEKLDGKALRELFAWRDQLVIDSQQVNLLNRIGDEICFRARFYAYVRLSEEPVERNGRTMLKPGTNVTFFTLQTTNGDTFYPVFTDQEEIARWKTVKESDPRMVIVDFTDFLPILKSSETLKGIVINPMSENFLIPRRSVEQWTAQRQRIVGQVREQAKKAREAKDPAVEAGKVVRIPHPSK